MQLRRIEIRDFRKLGHTVVDGIGDGLCVIVGDNEAGKSTILAALRAVLFERHRATGEHVKRMLPYGQTVRPEISVDFDLAGHRWRLRKAFVQRPEAELEGGGVRLTGDAVEERLAELLRFTPPGRGESKRDENQGLYGLLWVEQGQSHRALGVGEGGKSTLASAIEGEVGQIVGGERGRVLLAAAAQRHDVFWGRNDKPRGEYRALGEELDRLRQQAATIEQAMLRFEDKVQALATRTDALDRHRREDRLAKTIETARQHRRVVEHAATIEAARDLARRAVDAAERDCTIAAERRQRRIDMIARLDQARHDRERAFCLSAEARDVSARQEALVQGTARDADRARQIRLGADRHLHNIEQALARRRRQEAFEALAAQLAQAEAQALRRRDILASVASVAISATTVAELERLQGAVERAASALAAASVRIEFEPDGARDVTLDGSRIASDAPLGLCQDAVLRLEGFGRLRIRPGGGVEDLARGRDNAVQARDGRLRDLGLTSVAEAEAQVLRRREADAEVASLDRLLSALAPRGLDALRQAVENERAVLARPLPDDALACLGADDAELETARGARDTAMDGEDKAKAAAEIGRAAYDAAARDHAIADDRANRAKAQQDAISAELGAARASDPDSALNERQAEAEAALAAAGVSLARAEVGLEGVDVATARLDLERAEGAERSIRADLARLTAEARDLEVELGALGQGGLGEELGHIAGRIERLERDKAAQDLEARASRLLLETLSEAQRTSKERWLGPVRQRVKPYLKFLEPNSDIVLDERTLEIEGIVRNGVAEPFSSLSVGAREQMAVITRLALADILRGAGASSALILDDALVNTDEARLERMHRVLQTAAKSLQVLVLTCRERDFVGLGEIKRL